jgi:universal stress protein F
MYKRILVPIDLQETDDRARCMGLEKSIELCRLYQASLYVLTVVPDMGMPIVANYFPPDAGDKIVVDAENMLHELVGVYIPKTSTSIIWSARGPFTEEFCAWRKK